MPTIKKIFLLTVPLALFAFSLQMRYRITPGRNVGPFYVGKTTTKELKTRLGEGQTTVYSWQSDYTKEVYTYTVLSYAEKGLKFFFYSEAASQRDYFGKIEVTKNCNVKTEEGLSLRSTRAEVSRLYGSFHYGVDTIEYLTIREIGIGFRFKYCKVAKPTDSIISIYIKQPCAELADYARK